MREIGNCGDGARPYIKGLTAVCKNEAPDPRTEKAQRGSEGRVSRGKKRERERELERAPDGAR